MTTAQEYLDAGNKFYEECEFEEAIDCYSEVINLVPKFWGAYFNRGICYSKLKEYEKAIKDFSDVISIDNSNKDAYIERALCYENIAKYDEVILDYTELIKLDPYNTEFYSARAQILERCNKDDAVAIAVKDYSKIIALDPTNTDAFKSRANCYKKMEEYQKAINDYTKSIELDPDNAYHYKDRADCYIKLRKYDEATSNLETAIEKRKYMNTLDTLYENIFDRFVYIKKFDFATALQLNYVSAYGEIYYQNRAYTCVKMKKYSMAIDYLNKALEFADGFWGNIGKIYCDIAKCYNLLGKHEEANEAYSSAIEHYTNVIKYSDITTITFKNYHWRANCYKAIGEDDKALDDLAKINEIREEDIDEDNIDYEYYFDKANYYEQKNEIDKAKEYYIKTIEKCQEDDEYFSYTNNCNIVALCYEKIGEKNKAIEAYYKTIEEFSNKIEESSNPNFNYAMRASFYERIGDYEQAIEDYTNAIECNNFSAYYYKYRANCYEKIKDYEKAIADYKKAFVFEYESLSDILEIQEKLEKLSKTTSSSIKVFDNPKSIMKIIETPYDEFDEEDEESYDDETEEYIEEDDDYDEEDDDYDEEDDDYDGNDDSDQNNRECAAHLKIALDYLFKERKIKQSTVEFYNAYLINKEMVLFYIESLVSNDKTPEEIKKALNLMLDTCKEFEDSDISLEEVIEMIEKISLERNIDFSKLHNNPMQGRKLDI